jgi:phosphatidylserine decarboxylase
MFILIIFIVLLIAFIAYFGRSPARTIPKDTAIISPANGKIIAITTTDTECITFVKEGVTNNLDAWGITLPARIIVIEMNLRNVHVQRAPITGEVICVQHFKGKFKNALYGKGRDQLVNANEKNLIVIQNADESVAVIQVAGTLARRIKSNVHVGSEIEQGDKIGFIALGSQVVLVIPESRELKVKVGDRLTDGESVIAI